MGKQSGRSTRCLHSHPAGYFSVALDEPRPNRPIPDFLQISLIALALCQHGRRYRLHLAGTQHDFAAFTIVKMNISHGFLPLAVGPPGHPLPDVLVVQLSSENRVLPLIEEHCHHICYQANFAPHAKSLASSASNVGNATGGAFAAVAAACSNSLVSFLVTLTRVDPFLR